MGALLGDLQGLASALSAMKDLMAQIALPVQKVIQQMLLLASVTVMPHLILLMTGLLKIKEISTASMRGMSVGLQGLAPVPSAALGLLGCIAT
jgi:hypothetical protein